MNNTTSQPIILNDQLSLFTNDYDYDSSIDVYDNVIPFPTDAQIFKQDPPFLEDITNSDMCTPYKGESSSHKGKPSPRKGMRQMVYPIKSMDQLYAMAEWLYNNEDHKYLLGFIVGINLGLRANELLKLKLSDLYWINDNGWKVKYIESVEDTSDMIVVLQSKTSKFRNLFLNEACVQALDWYFFKDKGNTSCRYKNNKNVSPDTPLISSRNGGSIEICTFRKVLKKAADACGVKQNIGTHTLRKTWGWFQYKTNLEHHHGDVAQLQRLFGHDSEMTTLRYLGIMEEEEKTLYRNLNLLKIEELGFIKQYLGFIK